MPTNFRKLTGDLAQTSVGSATLILPGCSTTTGSAVVNTTASLAGVSAGQAVTGTGVPTGATIVQGSIAPGTFTLSANATATGTAVLTVANELQVVGLMGWEFDVGLKAPDATTTDDAAWESFLPSSKNWTVTSGYCYYEGDPSQRGAILATINQPGTLQRWNFFLDAVNSDDVYWGYGFISGLKLGAKPGEVVKSNVSIRGSGPLTFAQQTAPVVTTNTNTGLQAEV